MALLTKWWWRFKTEEGALWKKVIVALHGHSGMLGEDSSTRQVPRVWGQICRINKELELVNLDISGLFQRKIGDGKTQSPGLTFGVAMVLLINYSQDWLLWRWKKTALISDRIIGYENGKIIN